MYRPGPLMLLCALVTATALIDARVDAQGSAAPSAAVSTEAPLYDVEMVVFSSLAQAPEENWSTLPAGRGFGASAKSAEPPEVVRVLSPEDYKLDGVVRGLRISGAWRLIAHAAWIQTAPPWGTHTGVPLSQLGLTVPGLNGTVYLERAPIYLHLGFDVSWQNGATYTINEMRNVKQNEKEYFDHPAFGIIAVVTALKRSTTR